MQSESARASSAAEARFRVQAPNSLPRALKIIGLDGDGETVVRRLADGGWAHAAFFTAGAADGRAVLRSVSGAAANLEREIGDADLVVLLAGPGGHAHTAPIVGEACSLRRVTTTGLIV